ncbi:hypothetical protein [Cryptosporangium sp. NPDC048952]|uniref:hypothetical protein n=1 Tax=Cryptosporangium sp. NPDC048952 TaxID=3363961 RepID=UPI0037194033
MLYQNPADFCTEYAKAHDQNENGKFGSTSTLEEITVVSHTRDTARVAARWYTWGHDPIPGSTT